MIIDTIDHSELVFVFGSNRAGINRFLEFASIEQSKIFMFTRVGCGLSGYKDEDLVSIIKTKHIPKNVILSGKWLNLLNPDMPPRVIIAGGRAFNDIQLLTRKCDAIMSKIEQGNVTIVSGGAKGADTLGEDYAKYKKDGGKNYSIMRFPANWDKFNKPAGILRNACMSWYATHCIVFWDGSSRGTKSMIDIATSDGLPTRVIKYHT